MSQAAERKSLVAEVVCVIFGDALGLLHALRFPVHDVRALMAGLVDIENRSATLQDCAQPTCAAYGALPLRRNRDLLRAVLIEGAEARIAQVAEEKDKRRKHPQSPIEGTERKRSCCDPCDGCNGCDCSP